MSWILQGNPRVFDVDGYLAQYPLVYWSAPKHQNEIRLDDETFIWRSGIASGAIAYGIVTELPTPKGSVDHREALGDHLWTANHEEASIIKVGITLDEIRLAVEDGMVTRDEFMADPLLSTSTIIKARQGTIFRLTAQQHIAAVALWRRLSFASPLSPIGAPEGRKRLEQHYVRERSRWIIAQKKQTFRQQNGAVFCEICKFDFSKRYPMGLGQDFIEVHHSKPLSMLKAERRTELDDLMLVCSNCHRMLHRTPDIEDNLVVLRRHFAGST